MMRIESGTETGIVITYISEDRIVQTELYSVPSPIDIIRAPLQIPRQNLAGKVDLSIFDEPVKTRIPVSG
jgi:hypothetical protein